MKISIHLETSSHFYGPMSQVPYSTCPKISNFRNIGRVKSHFQAVRYQIVPHSRRSIYIFLLRVPTCLPYLFLISSNLFPWLNFEYWITCQLCRFRCKSATVYVLLHFSDFTWIFIDWVSASFFRCNFLLGLRKKDTRKKASKKCCPKLS